MNAHLFTTAESCYFPSAREKQHLTLIQAPRLKIVYLVSGVSNIHLSTWKMIIKVRSNIHIRGTCISVYIQ